jgi:hypothetical protein
LLSGKRYLKKTLPKYSTWHVHRHINENYKNISLGQIEISKECPGGVANLE